MGKAPRLDNTDEPLSGEVRYTDDEARDLYFLATWILPEGNSVRSGAIRIRLLPEKCGCWCSRCGPNRGREYFRWHRWTGVFGNWTYQCWLRWGPDRTPGERSCPALVRPGKWKPQRRDTANEVTMQGFRGDNRLECHQRDHQRNDADYEFDTHAGHPGDLF